MDDFGAFLARVIPLLRSEGTATLGPRKALWSHEDPVNLFGAEASASGWEAVERIFNRLAQSFSYGQSCTYDVVGAGVATSGMWQQSNDPLQARTGRRSRRHGHPAQPRHQRAPPGRSGQHRRRLTACQPTPRPRTPPRRTTGP
jgi:hypothetical protein